MKNPLNYLCIFAGLIFGQALPGIVIRPAAPGDLDAIVALDSEVTVEYFGPLYKTHFFHLKCGKEFDSELPTILAADRTKFERCTSGNCETEKLLVAVDEETQAIVGLLMFHLNPDSQSMELDLFMVQEKFRGQAAGKQLLSQAIETFKSQASTCRVMCLNRGNDKTLDFYGRRGFVRVGPAPADQVDDFGVPCSETLDLFEKQISGI